MLDIEIRLNKGPLGNIEDDIRTPIIKPNLMILRRPNFGLEGETDNTEDCDLKKQAKCIRSCKHRLWPRWTKEYFRDLRQQHNFVYNPKKLKLRKKM